MTDAHNHLQDSRFDGIRKEVIATMREQDVSRCVVNGTQVSDWAKVAELATQHSDLVIPSFGLHPWYTPEAPPDWRPSLTQHLENFPNAGIGECGLDRSIKNADLNLQLPIFKAQLELATEGNRPLSIHCVKAWGALIECLESQRLPSRGFLLHSYGGSAELIPRLVSLGAYFSFSGTILHPNRQKARAIFRLIPPDRLLIESDAPNQYPPEELITHPLPGRLNHPANITATDQAASKFLDNSLINNNFHNFFSASL